MSRIPNFNSIITYCSLVSHVNELSPSINYVTSSKSYKRLLGACFKILGEIFSFVRFLGTHSDISWQLCRAWLLFSLYIVLGDGMGM